MLKKLSTPEIEISDEDKEILKAQAKQVGKKLAIAAAVTVGATLAIRLIANRVLDKNEESETTED